MSRFKIYDRFTWSEIVALYPQKWLGLSGVVWDEGKIASAIIKYKDKTPKELGELFDQGQIEVSVLVMPDGMCVIGHNNIIKSHKND